MVPSSEAEGSPTTAMVLNEKKKTLPSFPPPRGSSVAALDQENDIRFSRIRNRPIEPEEYERAHKKLKETQYELSATRTTLEQKIIILEQAAKQSDVIKKKLISRMETLESGRRFLYEEERALRKKYQELEESSMDFKISSTNLNKDLLEQNTKLKEDFVRLQHESRATVSILTNKIQTLKAEMALKDQALSETQGTSQSQSTLAKEKHQQLADALKRVAELEDENRQLKLDARGQEDVARVERELKNQVAYITQLETTNRQLTADCKHYREVYRNVEVLKEEKTGLEQKLKILDDLRSKCGMLEVQKEVLVKEKQQWTAFLESTDGTDFNSPYELAKTIATLRGEKAAYVETKGELEAALRSHNTIVAQLETQIDELKNGLVKQEEFCKTQAAITRQHERSKELALRQAASLREHLNSYNTEETQLMGGSYDNQKTRRIAELEELIQEYHERLENAIFTNKNQLLSDESLESSGSMEILRTIQDDNAFTFSQLNRDNKALFESKVRLEQEIELLRKENASMDAKVLEYEIAIGAGAFNPATSRVLELKDSPASRHQAVRQQMLDTLKEENAALLKFVTQLQEQRELHGLLQLHENGDQDVALRDEGLIPAASYNRLKDDHTRLIHEMAESTKRIKRLKESWTLKADEFMSAVRSLLGYKINFLDNGRVELISIYSSLDEPQSFVFTSGLHDEGMMRFVGDGARQYMEERKEAYDHYVIELGSIPAFLSRLTLDLVEQQAQGQWQEQQPDPQDEQMYRPRSSHRHLEDDYTHDSDMMLDM
ncbi:coiled-coil domain-containing protein mad1 [Modicella reniformis]|uniref:Spindle assembly checkpoint component MAD1 n=1 Tax=Modicella reniformis TaxID=1440133 RepID=A0A9P6J5Z6_9FUNG|nr:coiled-coil domain-containing protein mad1 [Modicella reniformis]